MRKHHLADAVASRASDEPCGRDRVMRAAKWAASHQLRAGEHAKHAVNSRDLDRLAAAERRQDRRQALGEHRLARARRAAHEGVVASCGRNHEGLDGTLLSPHVCEVSLAGGLRRPARGMLASATAKDIAAADGASACAAGRLRRPWLLTWAALQDAHCGGEAACGGHLQSLDERRLGGRLERQHDARQPGALARLRDRERAATWSQPSVKRELAKQRTAGKRAGVELVAGGKDRAGDREV